MAASLTLKLPTTVNARMGEMMYDIYLKLACILGNEKEDREGETYSQQLGDFRFVLFSCVAYLDHGDESDC